FQLASTGELSGSPHLCSRTARRPGSQEFADYAQYSGKPAISFPFYKLRHTGPGTLQSQGRLQALTQGFRGLPNEESLRMREWPQAQTRQQKWTPPALST